MPSFWTSNGFECCSLTSRPSRCKPHYRGGRSSSLTPKSLTDPQQILAEVDLARKQGYAIVDEESEMDVLSIAAPIIESSGRAVAAINLPLPKRKWAKEPALERLLPELMRTAQTVGRSLKGVEF